jgi:hypothetical protein
MTTKQIAQRYMLAAHGEEASESLWPRAVKALQEFQAAAKAIKSVEQLDPESPEWSTVLKKYAFLPTPLAISTVDAFVEWVTVAFTPEVLASLEKARPRGSLLMEDSGLKPFLAQLDVYQDEIQKCLNQVGPERLEYKGFKVTNPLRVGGKLFQRALGAIDYFLAWFAKRGVKDLVPLGVKEVRIAKLTGAGGYYDSTIQVIALDVETLRSGAHTLLAEPWVYGTFLHELGHFVHMTYIKGEAKAFWDQTWDPVKALKRNLERVSQADLLRFYDLLEKDGFVPLKTAKRLKGADKVKFAFWLRNAVGDPLISPSQFRLTKKGEAVFTALRDPRKWALENGVFGGAGKSEEEQAAIVVKSRRHTLLLDYSSGLSITPADLEEIRKKDPALNETVEQAYRDLGVPSEYGKQDEQEDFADSFILFMTAPEKLSENALYRMKHTLWLSGFGGKPVMRLAQRVAKRFLAAQ